MNRDEGASSLRRVSKRRRAPERLAWPVAKTCFGQQLASSHDNGQYSSQSLNTKSQEPVLVSKSPVKEGEVHEIIIDDDDESVEIVNPENLSMNIDSFKLKENFGGNNTIHNRHSILTSTNPQRRRLARMQSWIGKNKTGKKTLESSSPFNNNNDLWTDKYSPNDVSDQCVAPKKVNEVRAWIIGSWQSIRDKNNSTLQFSSLEQSKLLILVGSPGVGKSTMVKILAKENHWNVYEWKDHYQNYQPPLTSKSSWEEHLPYQSQLSLFEEFLSNAGMGHSGIPLRPEESNEHKKTKANYKSKKNQNKRNNSASTCAIIMIDETPNIYSAEAAKKFRNIMTHHIQTSSIPTLLIFSNVSEGKHKPDDLERVIEPSILYSPLVKIVQCHAVTKSKMKKILKDIWRNENAESLNLSHYFIDDLIAISGGDLRHAIMTLQFHLATQQEKPKNRLEHNSTNGGSKLSNYRDEKLSTFHALGKLLYAKRKSNKSIRQGGELTDPNENLFDKEGNARKSHLDFNPEKVIESCDLDSGSAITFLGYHSPDFFSDISELSNAFDWFSDASLLNDIRFSALSVSNDGIFPGAYVSSLASRAVAYSNRNPTPNKFRQLSAPKVFDVVRKKKRNVTKMEQIRRRLSRSFDNHLPLNEIMLSSEIFVTDSLPFLRKILPTEINYALSTLHSYACYHDSDEAHDSLALESDFKLLRQQQVLEHDDIVDDDEFQTADHYRKKSNKYHRHEKSESASLISQSKNSRQNKENCNESDKIVYIEV